MSKYRFHLQKYSFCLLYTSEVIENLQEMEDEGEIYESIEDIWPDYPSKEDFFFNEEEY